MFLLFSLILPTHIFFFFFNDTATTEIYTLSLHDALPIWAQHHNNAWLREPWQPSPSVHSRKVSQPQPSQSLVQSSPHARSEEHTSELQSRLHLVCRLLLEKKKIRSETHINTPDATHATTH